MHWVKIIDNEENKNGVILRTESNSSIKYQTSNIAIKNTWLEVNDIINKNWVKVNFLCQVNIHDRILFEKLVLYLPLISKGKVLAKLEKDIILYGSISIKQPPPLLLENNSLTTENISRLVESTDTKNKKEFDLISESNNSTILELSEDKKNNMLIWIKNFMITDSILITSYQNILEYFKSTRPLSLNTRDLNSYLKQNFEIKKISGKINYKGIGIRNEKYSDIIEEDCIEEVYREIKVNTPSKEIIKSDVKTIFKKKNIPKHVKTLCWNLYIGEDKNSSKCVCCNSTTINITSFHCGHVIAEINGGETNINNLRPICSGCNLSMASMNMDDFIKMIRINLPEEDLLK
jgi:hypothetical protein